MLLAILDRPCYGGDFGHPDTPMHCSSPALSMLVGLEAAWRLCPARLDNIQIA